jgi:acylphosphatase
LTKHLRIAGLVQGVGYRAAFARRAQALKLYGWVRNRTDGSVEAVVHGPDNILDEMIDWAHHGPAGARVTTVSVVEADDRTPAAAQFEIRPTA